MTLKKVIAEQIAKSHFSGLAFAPPSDAVTLALTCEEFLKSFQRNGMKDSDAPRLVKAWEMCRDSSKNWITPSEILSVYRGLPRSEQFISRDKQELTPEERETNLEQLRQLKKLVNKSICS
jgi:hypothetical protein